MIPASFAGSLYDVPMVENNHTCSTDSSPMPRKQLEDSLYAHGITLNTAGQKLLRLFADGKMVCEALCCSKSDPVGGPFLMVAKVSLPEKGSFKELLAELTGDNNLAELFDPFGPAYVRVLRCRPAFWKVLKQACLKVLE